MKTFLYGISGIWAVAACVCLAAPEPAIVPAPGQWTVDMEFTHPQQLLLRYGSDNQPTRFWYTIITLTNNTGNDVGFFPRCDLMTDSFQIIAAGKSVTPAVFEQIKRRHESKYPFLEPLDKAGNKILEGEDNTKDLAIIWSDFDVQAKSIRLFITGLSNETAAVNHPVSTDETGKPLKVFLRKTLELNYTLRGDAALRSNASLAYEGKRWIMR
ncbi:MAG: hypothetical protein ACYSYV_03935 [Planctomycetota bacterium]|jgi:hypothetical protein